MTRIAARSAGEQSAAARSAVPWLTVIPLAVVLAYADGFWVVSLRGAVGAIERTQTPFESWLRESTLLVPAFVFAVLAALTLTLRWFAPALSRTKTRLVAGLMIVAAGTLTGVVELAASAAYDYHLQAQQLSERHAMASCAEACRAQQLHDTLALDVRAVFYGIGILLVSNLVLVAWVVALRGGRLDLTATHPRMTRALSHVGQVDDLRLLLAAGLVGSAVVHAAVVPAHLTAWSAAGGLRRPHRGRAGPRRSRARPPRAPRPAGHRGRLTRGTRALAVPRRRTPAVRTGLRRRRARRTGRLRGRPAGTGHAVAGILLLRAGTRPSRLFDSPHASRLVLVAIVAVTALGLGGSGPGGSTCRARAWRSDRPRAYDRPDGARTRFLQGASRILVGERGRTARSRGRSRWRATRHCGGSAR